MMRLTVQADAKTSQAGVLSNIEFLAAARPTAARSRSARGVATASLLLWIAQGLLALLFLFAGGMKLVTPIEAMAAQMPAPLPGAFLRFIGLAETLGAIGLVLPWLLKIRPALTPLAAAGLAIIMIGATGFTLAGPQAATAAVPFLLALVSSAIVYGRARMLGLFTPGA